MSGLSVRPASPNDFVEAYHIRAWVLEDSTGHVMAIGGFMVQPGGHAHAFLDVMERLKSPVILVKAMRKALLDNNKTVSVVWDRAFPRAPKLLRILGFTPNDASLGIWTWEASS